MTVIDDHNHFCIYCGARLDPGQNFCTQCGKAVIRDEFPDKETLSKYNEEIDKLEQEYNIKQSKAIDLVAKLFDPSHMAYSKFSSSITKSNQLFKNQVIIARRMTELENEDNQVVEREIENKLKTLRTFIDKMNDLTNELVIQLSLNKKDTEDINDLFNDMDDLINSVKDY